jgi:hypothetical protein
MLAGPVFSFLGGGGGVDVPQEEIFGGELSGRLSLLLIGCRDRLMIGRCFGLTDFLLQVFPFAG